MLSDEIVPHKSARERLLAKLGQVPLVFDGGMGSQLQARGLVPGELPEGISCQRIVLHFDKYFRVEPVSCGREPIHS